MSSDNMNTDGREQSRAGDTDAYQEEPTVRSAEILEKKKRSERRRKIITMIVSIIIACGLWIYVVEQVNPVTTRSISYIKVEIINQDELENEDLGITTEKTQYVRVTLSGRRSTLVDIKADDIHATADASECREGENYIDVKVHAPSDVTVEKVRESQIRLNVEKIVTEERNINVEFSGEEKDGYQATVVGQEPEKASVTGVSSAVAKVREIRAVIDTSDVGSQERRVTAELEAVDRNGKAVNGVSVSRRYVRAYVQLYKVKKVDLRTSTAGELPEGLKLVDFDAPSSVRIAAAENAADRIETVNAEAVSLSDITENTDVELQLDLPSGAVLADSQKTPTAHVRVAKITTQTLKYNTDKIKVENLENGLSLKFDEDTIDIKMSGTASELSDISDDDLEVTADASLVSEGKTTVALTVRIKDDDDQSGVDVDTEDAEVTVSSSQDE